MTDESRRSQTRRTVLKTGATLSVAALAGCTESTSGGDADESASTTTDAPADATTTTDADAETTADTSYSVSMEPVGTVEFDEVPETWVANNGSWADMGIALGQQPPEGVWLPGRYHTQYYDDIPGVSVDTDEMTALYQDSVSKELFYTLDGDVHVIDPNFLLNRFKGWDQIDIDEVTDNVAPFFGNSIFSGGYTWHEDYQYYSLYEAFEKLAAVFQQRDRFEAFSALHDDFQSSIDDVVPPEGERPEVAIMWAGSDEPTEFSPYLVSRGTSFKQWRDLGVRDALAETDVEDFHESRGRIDFETLLKIDPEHIMFRGQEAKSREAFEDTILAYMENHEVASQLTAVENGDVYRGGPLYQGPITNLVLTERAAHQVYDIDEQLFDRQRVADIVNGEF
ncbi:MULTISPECIES: ABC transporter substrate-binding protein [Halomicrobium]|uniref:Ferrichrome-binding protein n=2 Tax=Halomicrobium mukohataei TaxID=57705 RepID=C7NXU3_HALMD|nr:MULTISPECIES: ABC transporter substrate-binding protein [Halomicrobium]ACV46531.1 ferrichrome-binding protein [Halomicrobium mukohataei DSM 12286]QCD65074.1 Fe3+-hydroxamate ABC transporter substrate-binding protein [Halomicrobium mukohataei]QFR19880.1 ABC transporter substrate-binding protein [Halomicrobium sp. ZPS1]